MKKHTLYLLLAFFYLVLLIAPESIVSAAGCSYGGGSIGSELSGCLSGTDLVNPGDALIESGIRNKIYAWTNGLAVVLSLLAVGAIVYGAFLMTVSAGDDEKIKKGKDIVKWSLIGFFALIAAGAIIRFVTELIFAVSA